METRPEKDKRKRGRPVKNEIEPIPDTAKDIAKAMFKDADRKIMFNREK
ncbi:MAG: hypothetical protein JKY25_12630 [Robiginitomaculum sp.]|nr:hypothetical protein [Robiginitomaculum sp.]